MRVIETASAGSAGAPSAEAVLAHEHDWRQRAVLYEDGRATEEYGCAGCGGVTFR